MDDSEDSIGPLINSGYSAPPPRRDFVISLGAKLREELGRCCQERDAEAEDTEGC